MFRNPYRLLDQIIAGQAELKSFVLQLVTIGKKIMSQNDDLAAAVSALQASATSAEAAIATELAQIAAQSGSNPAVAHAITNIQAITAGLTASAASITPAPTTPASS